MLPFVLIMRSFNLGINIPNPSLQLKSNLWITKMASLHWATDLKHSGDRSWSRRFHHIQHYKRRSINGKISLIKEQLWKSGCNNLLMMKMKIPWQKNWKKWSSNLPRIHQINHLLLKVEIEPHLSRPTWSTILLLIWNE